MGPDDRSDRTVFRPARRGLTTRIRIFLSRLGGLLRRKRRDLELDEELQSHLEMQIEDNLRAGMTPDEARRNALLKAGGLEAAREACRDSRSLPLVETLLRDLRHSVRVLRRNPASTLLAGFSLALGIAATTAIFSVQKAILMAPLPYPDPDRLMVIWQTAPEARFRQPLTSPDYFDYRERNRSFEEIGVHALRWINVSDSGTPERVWGSMCTASFLRAVGVKPAMGRLFTEQEEQRQERLAVLSDRLWKRRFGADSRVIGAQIRLNREGYMIVGVMPAGFESPRVWRAEASAEMWIPVVLSREEGERSSHWLACIGRLRPGISQEAGEQDLRGIAAAIARQYPNSSARVSTWIAPVKQLMIRDVRRPIWFLQTAVWLLLLICCANVTSIQLARTSGRVSEVAIRTSLGAGRGRVLLQFLTETLVLAGAAGAVGVCLALGGVRILRSMLPGSIERMSEIRIDGTVLLVSLVMTLAAGILSGIGPALSASRLDVNNALRDGQGTATPGRKRWWFQHALVVGQFALALLLANSAALMMTSYSNVVDTSLAFDTERTLAAGISLEGPAYRRNKEAQAAFCARLLERVQAIPGVWAAAVTTKLPLEGGNNAGFLVEGEKYDPNVDRPIVERSWTTPGYFEAMGVPLVAGRVFAAPNPSGGETEIVVNRAFEQQYWPKGSALGRRVFDNEPTRDWVGLIVGVAEDVPQWGLEQSTLPEIYFPAELTFRANRHLIVRTAVPPLTLFRVIREAVASVDPEQPVTLRTMRQVFDGSSSRRRFNTVLFEVFAFLGLVMVVAGVYGVISCHFAQRSREVGIRMALGADRRGVVRMVLGRGLAVALLGIAIGLGGFLVLSQTLTTMLYGVSPTSAGTIALTSLLLLLIAAIGSAHPALRAASLSPTVILRVK